MPLMQTITDDWTTNNAANWDFWGGGNVTNNAGRLQFVNTNAASGYWGFGRLTQFELTGSYALLEAVALPTIAAGDPTMASSFLNLELDGANNRYFWEIAPSGSLSAAKVTAGAYAFPANTTYNAAVHKWFAISEAGGTVTWWYATTPTGPPSVPNGWTVFATSAATVSTTLLTWSGSIGNWGDPATQQYVVMLDNFNLPPSPPPAVNTGQMFAMF